jgi:hypothetical protein
MWPFKTKKKKPAKRCRRLGFERMEDRRMLAAAGPSVKLTCSRRISTVCR